MKKFFFLFAVVLLTLAGCSKPEADIDDGEPPFELSRNELTFSASGGTKSVWVFENRQNIKWEVVASWGYDWLTMSIDGTDITFKVYQNASVNMRVAEFRVVCGSYSETLTIKQSGTTAGDTSGDKDKDNGEDKDDKDQGTDEDKDQGTDEGSQGDNSENGNNNNSNGKYFIEDYADLDMKMIFVDGGSFEMGATSEQGDDYHDWELPVHTVTLDSFYIGECEVTQAQWYKVMGTTVQEQASKAGYSSTNGVGDNYPMYYVNWDEAMEFCSKLSSLTGRTYTLPTEAEWEYAARGGKYNDGTKYSGSNTIEDVAWYYDNAFGKLFASYAHPVKLKQPNGLGLYDMSGNVCEWCYDWYNNDRYSSSAVINPTGPSSGSWRVNRGGSWRSDAHGCSVSARGADLPSYRYEMYGFRVVCIP